MNLIDEQMAVGARVASRLTILGDTPDTVRDSLLAAGATGKRWSSACCPIARYLLDDDSTPLTWVTVGPSWVIVTLPDHETAHVATPPAVHAFLVAFDSGAYPELISAGAR